MAVKRRIHTASQQLRHELVPWPAGRHSRSVPLSCICMYIRTRVGGSRERPSPFRSRPPPSKVDIYNIEKGWSRPAGTRSTGNPRAEGITVRLWDCETGVAACRRAADAAGGLGSLRDAALSLRFRTLGPDASHL